MPRFPCPPVNYRLLLLWLAAAAASACLTPVAVQRPAEPSTMAASTVDQPQAHVFKDPDSGLALPYRLFVPADCRAERPCGLLLFLHGAGERGDDNAAQLSNDALGFIRPEVQRDNPTIVVYPQCPIDMQWVDAPWATGQYRLADTPLSKPLAAALRLLAWLLTKHPVDPRRLLVTGLSMGGYGTWDLLARQPGRFAGALALCGGGDPTQAATMRDVPIWAYHGDRDEAVPVRGSRRMIQALRKAGGNPRYTEVAGHGHDVWTLAYRDVALMRWLLAQRQHEGAGSPDACQALPPR
jgi:predicted peptidase